MDVGYYISELLGQHGDVNVPGLGYFAHTRVNGYYNDREGKFYPPGYSVQFDPQFLDDDDALAIHIAEKKKISIASSKYFTEKFVMGLKQQAGLGEVALAELGWFSMYNLQLIFRPNNGTSTDPEFFGYPAIKLHKIGKPPVEQQYTPETETYTPEPVAEQYTQMPYQVNKSEEEYLIDMTRNKRRTNIWVFIILTLIATTVAVVIVQRYNPKAFKFNFGNKKENAAIEPTIVVINDTPKTKPDTDQIPLIRNVPADSLTKGNISSLTDTASISRYEVLVGAFKTQAEASKAIIKYKSMGFANAKLVPDAPGILKKVSIGTFITQGLALDMKNQLIENKKFKEEDIDIELIAPKQKAVSPNKK